MTNGEKFKEIFSITQVDDCYLNVYAWLPIHDAIEIPLEWWNAEYKEPTTKNELVVDCIDRNSIKYYPGQGGYMYASKGEIDKLPSVKPQSAENNLGVDCISRQAVLDLINADWKYENLEIEINNLPSVTPQEPVLDKINKMKSEIADSLEFWDYSPNNNPLARDMLETLTNFWGDMREVKE